MKKFLFLLILLFQLCCGGGGGSKDALPPGPTGFSITRVSDTEIRLNWTTSPAIDGFEIERKVANGPFQKVHSGLYPATLNYANYYVEDTIPDKTIIYFRIRSISGGKASAYSNELAWDFGLRPITFLIAYLSDQGIRVEWTNQSWGANANLVLKRQIVSPQGTASSWETIPTSAGAWNYTETQIQEGSEWQFRAYNETGTSQSSIVESVVVKVPLSPPEDITTTSMAEGISLGWRNVSENAKNITILKESDNYGNFLPVAILPPETNTFTAKPLVPGSYRYKVAASTYRTNYSSSTVQVNSLPIPPPTSVVALGLPNSVSLSWTPQVPGTPTVVERLLPIPYPETWAFVAELPPGTTQYLDTGQQPGKIYYRLGAKGACGSYFGDKLTAIATPSKDIISLKTSIISLPWGKGFWFTQDRKWWVGDWSDTGIPGVLYRPEVNGHTPLEVTDPYKLWGRNPVQFDEAGNPTVYYMNGKTERYGEAIDVTRAKWDGSGWTREAIANSPSPIISYSSGVPPSLFIGGTNGNPLLLWTNDLTPDSIPTTQIEWTRPNQGNWPVLLSPLGKPSAFAEYHGIINLTTDGNGVSYVWVVNSLQYQTPRLFSISPSGVWREIHGFTLPIGDRYMMAPAQDGFGLFYSGRSDNGSTVLSFIRYSNETWLTPELIGPFPMDHYEFGGTAAAQKNGSKFSAAYIFENKILFVTKKSDGSWGTSELFSGDIRRSGTLIYDHNDKLVILVGFADNENLGHLVYGMWEEE